MYFFLFIKKRRNYVFLLIFKKLTFVKYIFPRSCREPLLQLISVRNADDMLLLETRYVSKIALKNKCNKNKRYHKTHHVRGIVTGTQN